MSSQMFDTPSNPKKQAHSVGRLSGDQVDEADEADEVDEGAPPQNHGGGLVIDSEVLKWLQSTSVPKTPDQQLKPQPPKNSIGRDKQGSTLCVCGSGTSAATKPPAAEMQPIAGENVDDAEIDLEQWRSNQNEHGYRGVKRLRGGGGHQRFTAQLKRDGKQCCIGVYDTVEEAARAHAREYMKLHGAAPSDKPRQQPRNPNDAKGNNNPAPSPCGGPRCRCRVEDWLYSLGLSRHCEKFDAAGYGDLVYIMDNVIIPGNVESGN